MKNRGTLAVLLLANSISGFATGITMLAIPWYLVSSLGKTNGKLLNTEMMLIITVLILFWGTYAGTLIDKYNRKRIFQWMNLTNGIVLISASLAGIYWGVVPFYFIALVAGATLFAHALHYPNLYAFIQELYEPRLYSKINSLLELQNQLTTSVGMITGGLLLAGSANISWLQNWITFEPWELQEIFLMDGITYLISFLLISLIKYVPGEYTKLSSGNVITRIKFGYRYLKDHPSLMVFGICSYVMFFSVLVFIQVMLPIYVNDYLSFDYFGGARVMSEFRAVYSLGAVTAGLVGLMAPFWISRIHITGQIIFLILLSAGIFIIWTVSASSAIFISTAWIVGISNAGIRILRITYIVRIVPNHMVGRVNSFFSIINVSMRILLISVLVTPFFSDKGNGSNIIFGTAALSGICLLAAIILIAKFSTFDKKASYG